MKRNSLQLAIAAAVCLGSVSLAAPTHLHVTGHFDPQTQPDYVDIERIRLLTRPTETNADS